MARPVTLQQLRADIADQCDVVSGATGRYSASLLNRFLNKSIQRFRERLSTEGITHYLVSKSGNLSSGPTSPFPFQVLDMSSFDPGVVRTFGVDITYNGRVTSLEHRPFQERATFGSTTDTGCPIAWAHYQTDKIAIFPAPDAGYAYTVWYLPVYDDLSDSDTFDGVAGWEDYLVQDVVCRVLNRDQYLAAVQSAERQRDGIFADLIRAATKVSAAGGAVRGRDTFGAYAVGYGRRGPIAAGGAGVSDGSVTNAKLAEMAAQTIKANIQSVPAQPVDATPAQIAAILPSFSGTSAGLVPTGTSNAALYLSQAGWAAVSAGSVAGPTGAVQFNGGGATEGATGIRVVASGQAFEFGANPATEGPLRFPNNVAVMVGRNTANDGDVALVSIAAGDRVFLGDGEDARATVLTARAGGFHDFWFNNSSVGLLNQQQLRLGPGLRLGLVQLAIPDSVGDKLGGWTASGFANVATGINITASGTRLSVGSGGPQIHASGIDMRSSDIRNVRRINNLDGIKVYGDLPNSNADVTEPSGTAFIIPGTVSQGRVYTIVPSGTEHGKIVLIENRSAFSHSIYNSGTGMGAASGWIATLAPSGGLSARFASGAWEYGVKYQLGSF